MSGGLRNDRASIRMADQHDRTRLFVYGEPGDGGIALKPSRRIMEVKVECYRIYDAGAER